MSLSPCISATPCSSFSLKRFIMVSLISLCTFWFLKKFTVGNTFESACKLVRSIMITSAMFRFDCWRKSNKINIRLILCSMSSALCYKSVLLDSPKSAIRISAVRNSSAFTIFCRFPVIAWGGRTAKMSNMLSKSKLSEMLLSIFKCLAHNGMNLSLLKLYVNFNASSYKKALKNSKMAYGVLSLSWISLNRSEGIMIVYLSD